MPHVPVVLSCPQHGFGVGKTVGEATERTLQ